MVEPDEIVHQKTECLLRQSGWTVQVFSDENKASACGLVVRNFPLSRAYGSLDYLLFIDGKAAGLIEVKHEGERLDGVPLQSEKYRRGLPFSLRLYTRPLPFLYQHNNSEICFTNAFDPEPAARGLQGFHRPETLRQWLTDGTVGETPRDMAAAYYPEHRRRGRTFHERVLINMPVLVTSGLSAAEIKSIQELEGSLEKNSRRIFLKTVEGLRNPTMIRRFVDRLLRYVDSRRILILLDQKRDLDKLNDAFKSDISSADTHPGPQFLCILISDSNNAAHNGLDPEARICLSTFETSDHLLELIDEGILPIEAFEVIIFDECATLLKSPRNRILTYFDAHLIGISNKADQATIDFFSEEPYRHNQGADGLNVLSQ